MSVLVLGSNGFLGLHIVDALRAEGVEPRCGRRRRSNVLGLRSRKADMVLADLEQPDSLLTAMAGCRTVVHAAGHYPRLSLDPEATWARGERETAAVLDAAVAAGVQRLVYVSTTATVAPAPEGPSDERHVWPHEPPLGTYHRLKWRMEQQIAAEQRLETVIALPAGCLGPGDLRVGTSALLVGLAHGMDPPHPDGPVSLVDPRDVGRAVARLALDPDPPRRLVLSGGTWSLHSLMVELAERYGVPVPSDPLPDAEILALADEAEHRAQAEGGRAALSREIVDLVVHGVPLSAALAEQRLGLRFTPLSDSLDAFDRWARGLRILPPEQELHP